VGSLEIQHAWSINQMKSGQTYYSKVVFGHAYNQRAAMAYGSALLYIYLTISEMAKLSGQITRQ